MLVGLGLGQCENVKHTSVHVTYGSFADQVFELKKRSAEPVGKDSG